MDIDTTIEGRERYRVNVRYPRELRDDPEKLRNVLVPIPRMRPASLPGSASPSVPIMFDTGVGADVAKRIAAPMWGGLVSLTLLTLLVIPAVYVAWRSLHLWRERRGSRSRRATEGSSS